jgi:hypothetical protein
MKKFILFAALALLSFANYDYSAIEGFEYYHYANAVYCDDATIINWSCEYPCRNTTGMIDTRVC